MSEYNRNKFWLALGRCGAFSEGDCHLFRVWPKEPIFSEKNHFRDLFPKFMEADNLAEARRKAHLFVDNMFNEFTRADIQYGHLKELPVEKPAAPANPDELAIEGAPEEKKPDNNGLLDLTSLI